LPHLSHAWVRRLAVGAGWLCLAVVAAAWMLERFAGDRWWLSVPLLYGPQWIWIIPFAFAVALAAWARIRWLWIGVGGALLMLCNLLGFVVSCSGSSSPQAFRIRVLSSNLAGAVQPYRLMELLAAERPQVIALQENSANDLLAVLERDG